MHNPICRDADALANTLASHRLVPGVAVATVIDGAIRVAAAGTADAQSGAAVEPDMRFRPGSVTKLLTATLVMQCVDAGLVGLDDPVLHYLPGLELADPERAGRVTVRHLLSHSSGIDAGDLFVDTGAGDDCLQGYVRALQGTGFLFDPGETFSYCNAGIVLAGRIAEVVCDATWEDALRRRVLGPLEMTSTGFAVGAHAPVLHPGAGAVRGHRATFGGVQPVGYGLQEPYTCRALGPAGGTLVSTAADLARLAAAHLGMPGFATILSPQTAAQMRALAVRAPGGVASMLGAGLGWQVWRGSVRAAGANPGQSGVIALDEDESAAFVVLTNCETGVNAVTALLDIPAPASPAKPPLPLDRYCGTYVNHALRFEVGMQGDALQGRLEGFEGTATLTPLDEITCASPLGPIAFVRPDAHGRPTLARWRMRAARRL